jgi:HlyD family secretion protein
LFMSVRRSLFILAIFVVALPFFIFSNANQPQASSDGVELSNLQVYQVQRGTVALSVSAVGAIEAESRVSLNFLVAGEVAEIFVAQDDYVLAGDDLIRLDNESQRIAYDQALLRLDDARLAYQDLETVDEDDILLAQAAVDAAQGQYYSAVMAVNPADIEAADLRYEQALANIEDVRIERDNIGGQYGGDSVQWEIANAQYGEATFNAEIARLQAQDLRNANGPAIRAAAASLNQAEAELEQVLAGATQAELDAAALAIEQAENDLDRAETEYNRTILKAPITGVVTAINVELGGLVAPSLVVLEIMDIEPLGLTVQVDEIDIGLVQLGQSVRVNLDALADLSFPATVTSIAPLGNPSGGIVSYDVGIALEGQDPRVRVGMTAEATIVIQETVDVLLVPNLYIRRDLTTNRSYVLVLRPDNSVEEVEVTVGIQGRDSSEILSGLAEGDLVAIELGGGDQLFGGGQN